MDSIIIDVGVHTSFEIDLTEIPMDDAKQLRLTIKNGTNKDSTIVVERVFNTNDVHIVTISPVESYKIFEGAKYDIVVDMIDGKCYKATENGNVVVNRGVGQCKE